MNIIYKLFIIITTISMTLFSEERVMCWLVNDESNVDGINIKTFMSPYVVDDDHWIAARVNIISPYHDPVILSIWGEDPYGLPEEWDGYYGVELTDIGSGEWGTGKYVQSSFSFERELMEEILFKIELGYNSWDDELGDVIWKTLAESDSETLADLYEKYTYETFSLAPPVLTSWNPLNYHTITIPESDTTILMIIGIGFLLLIRKNYIKL